MRTNYIEQMSVADRNNSLSGYYNSLIKRYEEYYHQELKALPGIGDNNDACSQVINSGYLSFAAILQRGRDLDNNPGTYTSEEYAAHKFKLSKYLNLIEKILYKICYGSIDSSITEENAEIENVKQAMTWLFVDCVDSKNPSYQDVERVKMILTKTDIIRRIRSITHNNSTLLGEKITEKCLRDLNNSVSNNHTKMNSDSVAKIPAMCAYKGVIRNAINDMFRVLSNLLNFSQYLAVVEETAYPNMMMQHSTFQTLEELKTKPNMEKILALADGVKTLLIEYFSNFVKIKNISLPHSYLSSAQFSHSTITNGNFMSSDISNANLSYATARDCDFSMCAMDNIYAPHADFTGSNFNYSSLIGADLSNAILNDTALNSITLLDNRILQRNLYVQQSDDDSRISYENASEEIQQLFDSYIQSPKRNQPDLRENVITKLGKHYAGENRLSGALEYTYSQKDVSNQYYCPFIIKYENTSVLDELNKYVKEELVKYSRWCATQFIHPKCLEWASSKVKHSTANLESASVKNSVMPDCSLSIIPLKQASFQNTDLNSSTYYYTDARSAFFGDCNMAQTKAGYSDFYNATFNNTNLIGAQFINCRLSETNFTKALLIDVTIINTSPELFYNTQLVTTENEGGLIVTQINESDLAAQESTFIKKAVVAYADMQDADFSNCIANNIAIVGVNMDRSIFYESNLKRAFIYNCLTRWTDYSSANLSYALIIGNAFGHSSLPDANFTSARIFACDFSDCDMRNINLINTRIDNTIFSNCDLGQTNFSNTEFKNCYFKNLNMLGANFTNCVFTNCTFNSIAFDKVDNQKNLFTAKFINCCFVDKKTYESLLEIKEKKSLGRSFLKDCKTP